MERRILILFISCFVVFVIPSDIDHSNVLAGDSVKADIEVKAIWNVKQGVAIEFLNPITDRVRVHPNVKQTREFECNAMSVIIKL